MAAACCAVGLSFIFGMKTHCEPGWPRCSHSRMDSSIKAPCTRWRQGLLGPPRLHTMLSAWE
eukprot:14693920-Alexandrium_andersonii.AAC.1